LKKKKHRNIQSQKSENIDLVLIVVFSVLLLIPPFFRGMYFEDNQFYYSTVVFFSTLIFFSLRSILREKETIQTILDMFVLSISGLYWISNFWSVSVRHSYPEALKYSTLLCLFYAVSRLASRKKARKIFCGSLVLSGALLVIFCFDAVIGSSLNEEQGTLSMFFNGLFQLMGADKTFFDLYIDGRFYSNLQYANAFGAFVGSLYFVSTSLVSSSNRKGLMYASVTLSFLLFCGIVFSQSRAVFILFISLSIFYLFRLRNHERNGLFACFFSPIMSFIVLTFFGYYGVVTRPQGEMVSILVLTIMGMILSSVLLFLLTRIGEWKWSLSGLKFSKMRLVLIGVLVLFLLSLLSFALQSQPILLEHKSSELNSIRSISRHIELKENERFLVRLNMENTNEKEKRHSLYVDIRGKSDADILQLKKGRQLSYTEFQATNGREERTIEFQVPEDTKVVEMIFGNYYSGTSAKLYEVEVCQAQTKKKIKSLHLGSRYIPQDVLKRFDGFMHQKGFIERTYYMMDGWSLMKARLLWGHGGNTWRLQYFSHQSYDYWSTQAHNHLIQVGVETGLFGLVLYLGIFACCFVLYRNLRIGCLNNKTFEKGIEVESLFVAILFLGFHATMDFDFSIFAVYILLFSYLAILNGEVLKIQSLDGGNSVMRMLTRQYSIRMRVGFLILFLLFFAYQPISYLKAKQHYREGLMMEENFPEKARTAFQKAMMYDPDEPLYTLNVIRYELMNANTHENFSEILAMLEKLEAQTHHRYDLVKEVGRLFLILSQITDEEEKALQFFERATELRPMNVKVWEKCIDGYFEVILDHHSSHDIFKNGTFDKFYQAFLQNMDQLDVASHKSVLPMQLSPKALQQWQILKLMKNRRDRNVDYHKVKFYNGFDIDINHDFFPDVWQPTSSSVSILKQSEGLEILSEKEDDVVTLSTFPIQMEKLKRYQIYITLENLLEDRVYKYRVSKKEGIFRYNKDSGILFGEFETEDTFQRENSVIEFEISSSSMIKEMVVFEK
jgi:tetratricopeptide (TPR) repeat protein